MAIERAIRTLLVDDGGVAALVGSRVFPIRREQGSSLPAIVYQQISGPRFYKVTEPMGWVESRFQVTCWAGTYAESRALSDAVREAVGGYSGTSESVIIDHVFIADEGDVAQLTAGNAELAMYGKRLDIEVVFHE